MSRRDQLLMALAFVAFVALALGRLPEVMETPISAAENLHRLVYPFVADEGPWYVADGYYDGGNGSPEGYQHLSLSFAAETGVSTGRAVVAPASGKVNWIESRGLVWSAQSSNCMSIQIDGDTSHYVAVCHVLFDHVYGVGDQVSRGERIGVIGPKDDFSAFPRIQLILYTAPSRERAEQPEGRRAAPFIAPWGLSGCDYPDDGSGLPQYAEEVGLPDRCPSAAVSATPAPSRPTSEPASTPVARPAAYIRATISGNTSGGRLP